MNTLQSEQVILSAPMSLDGAIRRIWRWYPPARSCLTRLAGNRPVGFALEAACACPDRRTHWYAALTATCGIGIIIVTVFRLARRSSGEGNANRSATRNPSGNCRPLAVELAGDVLQRRPHRLTRRRAEPAAPPDRSTDAAAAAPTAARGSPLGRTPGAATRSCRPCRDTLHVQRQRPSPGRASAAAGSPPRRDTCRGPDSHDAISAHAAIRARSPVCRPSRSRGSPAPTPAPAGRTAAPLLEPPSEDPLTFASSMSRSSRAIVRRSAPWLRYRPPDRRLSHQLAGIVTADRREAGDRERDRHLAGVLHRRVHGLGDDPGGNTSIFCPGTSPSHRHTMYPFASRGSRPRTSMLFCDR